MKKYLGMIFVFASVNGFSQNTLPTSGNVGIGTTTPYSWFGGSSLLQIQGTRPTLRLAPNYDGGLATIHFKGSFSEGTPHSNDEFHLNYVSSSTNPSLTVGAYYNGVKNALSILGNGNVGIGMTNPQTPLDVTGAITIRYSDASGGSLLSFASGGSSATFIQENWGLNLGGTSIQPVKIYNSSLLVGYGSGGNDIGTGNLFVQNNVGIGTTTPGSYKLAVEGKIGARKIVVTQAPNWPDYVFDSSYTLTPLAQIEQFIKDNKHLPDVPSAKEVAEKGLDVGDNQAVLLKKIEELTLYMIQQNKTIEELKNEVLILKNEKQIQTINHK
ncbi:hypothetical protein ACI6Q2_23185 [Chitinophagaceae bacterium LWZ2-11]